MFGWFEATCPVEPKERAWLEARMRWLVGEFGLDRARRSPVILPTPTFFPEPYDGTPASGRTLFDRVAGYAGVASAGIELVFVQDEEQLTDGEVRDGAAGLYEGSSLGTRICIVASALRDPLTLVATAAHELGHVLLLGQGRLYGDEPDHEELTDLLTIYLGFGVFTANAQLRDRTERDGTTERWSIRRLGYLSHEKIGYALALYARLREEQKPAWEGELRADVRSVFRKAARWLRQEGDKVMDEQTGTPAMLSDDELPPGYSSRR